MGWSPSSSVLSSLPVSVKNLEVPEEEEEEHSKSCWKEHDQIFFTCDRVIKDSFVSCSSERNMEWESVSHWVVNISLFHENVDMIGCEETNVSTCHRLPLKCLIVVVNVCPVWRARDFNNDLSITLFGWLTHHQKTSIISFWEISSNIAPWTLSEFILLFPCDSPAETFSNRSFYFLCFVSWNINSRMTVEPIWSPIGCANGISWSSSILMNRCSSTWNYEILLSWDFWRNS